MEAIKLLILIFAALFIVERKPMNIIFNFIGLVVTVAILLGQSGMDYLSYLLIIIYCSALTIIFGFVIMLTPTSYSSTPTKRTSATLLTVLAVTLAIVLFNYSAPFEITSSTIFDGGCLDMVEKKDSWNVINKIGNLLYTEEINIIKFMIATLILLLALVALFFVLMPTL